MNDAPIQTAATQGHSCPQCGTILDAQDRFCRSCGLEQNIDTAAVASLIGRILPGRIDAALKDRLRDQTTVELETAELVAERAMKWLKTLGFFLGIPIVVVIALFSFVGIKTWSDMQNVATQTVNLQKTLTDLASQTADLQKTLVEPKRQLAQAVHEIDQLKANLADAKTLLAGQLSEVSSRQNELKNDLDSYRTLRQQLYPSGSELADPALTQYVKSLFGPSVAIGPILTGAQFASLREKISACIVARNAGQPCQPGSLAQFVP